MQFRQRFLHLFYLLFHNLDGLFYYFICCICASYVFDGHLIVGDIHRVALFNDFAEVVDIYAVALRADTLRRVVDIHWHLLDYPHRAARYGKQCQRCQYQRQHAIPQRRLHPLGPVTLASSHSTSFNSFLLTL